MRYEHLTGLPFEHGKTDCYELVRRFYKDNFDIELTNYARPDFWWRSGLNLYMDNFRREGFELVDVAPHQAQPADIFLTAVQSSGVANHAGVYLGRGLVLHHFTNRFSEVVSLKGIWRNSLCAIIRHREVQIAQDDTSVDLRDLILPHKRKQIDELAPGLLPPHRP